MIIKAIVFKRKEDSNWESGISFETDGNMNNKIIDSNGNTLTSDANGCVCYDIKDCIYSFCVDLQPILDNLK